VLNLYRNRRRSWHLFASSILVASLLMLLPTASQPAPAHSSPYVACTGCYGLVQWIGATFGAKTNVYVNNLYVPQGGYQNFLTEGMWLADTNTGAWTEIGYYSGAPSSWNDISYYYAYTPPYGYYTEVRIGSVTPPDRGGYSWIKITRNRQTRSTLRLDIWSTYYYTNFITTINNNQGGYDWAGNRMDIGSELDFNDPSTPSSNGVIRWRGNSWQLSNGNYMAQTTNVWPVAYPYVFQHPYWEVWPSQSPDGGIFANWCCN